MTGFHLSVRTWMTAALVLAAMAVCASPASGQALGTIDFPTSGSPAAQQSFIHGVLFMHSFEYPSALAEFQKAEQLDPGFVMAYWGEAMTYTHPVWNRQNRDKARATTAARDNIAAVGAYADLASVWRHADTEVPGLAEVWQNGGVGATK
jgi:hypothetical protein